jgi:hypothetical protein
MTTGTELSRLASDVPGTSFQGFYRTPPWQGGPYPVDAVPQPFAVSIIM